MEAPQWWPLITACMTITHCLVLVGQVACNQIDPSPQDIPPRPVLPCHKISVSNIDFAFSLYRQLALDTPGENFLFSPASINLALAKLSLGAPITSRAQLLESLGFNLTLVSEAEIQDSFRDLLLRLPVEVPQFLLTTGQHRFSGLGATQDLGEAQKHIAAYIEKQTWGRLGTWGQDLRNETTVVLVNHMLLKGKRVHIQPERLWNPGSICTPALLPTMNKKPALQIRRPLVSVH